MNDLTVILPKALLAKTNNDDLEFKLCRAIQKVFKPKVEVRVSKMTSNKVCLNLTLAGYIETDDVEVIRNNIVVAVAFHFGDSLKGVSVATAITCTIFEEVETEIL
ncbi:MAG: hypothetical protein UX08_C0012G0043 [Candidatus Collierbacteria bacterium GW2011_GWB1_45_35]|uniref:Uncharacterized protein n=2 Tax=Candidatus Collieribacteriota TaxID=1752725 RepID=A0A0G1MVQ4_9BACT|nr:MAG: hypothetical protein UW48_C0001G0147 [Microgenomates group bacterium GW2011_GWC1_44_23]KKT84852.1 MAG: hypothetical protein UW84_C0047G0007 [Candidatus Collierbacteria bacterium GW2011_GWA2_44_99]KKT96267.1 MAG: hypothetical protein UW96_C0001G0145 [Candidatus Collierbacteria bacterium GW2011_GWA1_45_15]KKU01307.1 MAG: hypothetical protein UX01_C0001G0151 [Candidatus Collierbacteria bacterium GW2011_GWB2_45_17]KKU05010.1 MAG: hypothetical protein UX08_C0012G0043 [Candidatus Collierbacte